MGLYRNKKKKKNSLLKKSILSRAMNLFSNRANRLLRKETWCGAETNESFFICFRDGLLVLVVVGR